MSKKPTLTLCASPELAKVGCANNASDGDGYHLAAPRVYRLPKIQHSRSRGSRADPLPPTTHTRGRDSTRRRSVFPVEPLVRMLLVFFCLAPLQLRAMKKRAIIRHAAHAMEVGDTHRAGARGSTSARCCMLTKRSLNKFPSGFKRTSMSAHCRERDAGVRPRASRTGDHNSP